MDKRERTHKYLKSSPTKPSEAPTCFLSPTSPDSRPKTSNRGRVRAICTCKVDKQCCPTTALTIRGQGGRSRIRHRSNGGGGQLMLTVSGRMPAHALIVAGHSSVPSTWTAMYGLVSHPILSYALTFTILRALERSQAADVSTCSQYFASHPSSLSDWILMTVSVL